MRRKLGSRQQKEGYDKNQNRNKWNLRTEKYKRKIMNPKAGSCKDQHQ